MIDLREKHELEDSMGFRGQLDEHRRFQIEFLREQGLTPSDRLLEIGCGPLTAGLPIINYLKPGNYTGVDIRNSVLNLGWTQIGKAGLSAKNPRLICSAAFGDDELDYSEKFDYVFSFSVLFHFSDEVLDSYFGAISRRLVGETGKCFANINDYLPSDKWLEFPFSHRPVEGYIDLASRHGLKTTNLGKIMNLGFRNETDEKYYPLLMFEMLR
jgi:methyltransferase family protein